MSMPFMIPIGMRGGSELPVLVSTGVTTANGVAGSGGTLSCNAPASIAAGNFLLLAVMSSDSSGGPQERWVTPPSGWTRLGSIKETFPSVTIFYKVAAGGEGSVTITNDSAVSQDGVVVYYNRITGVDPTNPFNGSWSALSSSGTPYAPTGSGGSTTAPNCLGFNFAAARQTNGGVISVSGTGWTRVQDHRNGNTDVTAAMSTKPMATIGIQSAISFTCSIAPSDWAVMTLALNPVAPELETYPVLASYSTKKSAVGVPASSFSIDPPSGINAGDMLVLIVCAMNTTGTDIITTPSGGWNKVTEAGSTAADAHVGIYYKTAAGGETAQTVNLASSPYVAWWLRITGCTGFDSFDEYDLGSNNPIGIMRGLMPTTTRDKCLLLGAICTRSGVTGTDFIHGGGSLYAHTEDTVDNSINNAHSIMLVGKASRAGSHAGDMVIHERTTGSLSVFTRAAAIAAFYP